ncbi:MAG: tetratricopeptide repeat protein, partial [Bacillus sp. (in: firmicutes)]
KEKLSDAKTHLQKAIQLDPKFHEAYFNLALINLEQKNLEEAKRNIEKAVKIKPNQQKYSELLSEINRQLQLNGG